MKKDKEFKIFNEIMNDAFWLGYILEIKRKITDYSQKEILSSFLIFYSSIFAEETIFYFLTIRRLLFWIPLVSYNFVFL